MAPSTGLYTIRIWKTTSPTEANNEVGIAWSRQATFLPDIRRNNGGWTSTITIRNDGKLGRVVRTTFIRQDNSAAWPVDSWLAPNASLNVPFPAGIDNSFWGNTVIDGNEDISAVVVQERANPNAWDAYSGISSPDTEILVPLVHLNNSGWNSQLILQNAGGTIASVRMDFYAVPGHGRDCPNQSFNVGGGMVLWLDPLYISNSLKGCLDNPSDAYPDHFVGSVRIASLNNVPLAVVSTQYKGPFGAETSLLSTTNGRAFAATLQAPLVQNNNSGWFSGMNLQNGLSSGQGLAITYHAPATGAPCYGPMGYNLNPFAVANVFPAPPTGNGCPTTVSAELGSNQVAVAQINQIQSNSAQAFTYRAIGYPSKLAIVPRLRKDSGWQDGMQIRTGLNLGNTTVTLVYYNQDGSVNGPQRPPLAIGPRQSVTLLSQGTGANQIPAGFNGSVVVMATQPVAVVVNVWKSGAGGDEVGSYPANHR